MIKLDDVYVAIRKDNEREWIDIQTISLSASVTIQKYRDWNSAIPGWAHDNPVVRISKCELNEISIFKDLKDS